MAQKSHVYDVHVLMGQIRSPTFSTLFLWVLFKSFVSSWYQDGGLGMQMGKCCAEMID